MNHGKLPWLPLGRARAPACFNQHKTCHRALALSAPSWANAGSKARIDPKLLGATPNSFAVDGPLVWRTASPAADLGPRVHDCAAVTGRAHEDRVEVDLEHVGDILREL